MPQSQNQHKSPSPQHDFVLQGLPPHPRWDRDAPPVLTAPSGSVLEVHCPEPCGQITPESSHRDLVDGWDQTKVHALIGPIDIDGAKAGDRLRVDVLKLKHHGWGWSGLCPGFGLLQDRFPDPYLHHWSLDGDRCRFGPLKRTNGTVIEPVVPYAPFLGCLGVAPADPGVLNTAPPRDNAGNIDTRHLIVGSRIDLPVLRDGAGLCLGDGHAAQGDGEVCGTAIEAPLTATVRLTILPQDPQHPDPHWPALQATLPPKSPPEGPPESPPESPPQGPRKSPPEDITFVDHAPRLLTQASGPDVRNLARQAVNHMVDRLIREWHLPPEPAAILCSACGDLSISQAVNEPNWTVSFRFPLAVLNPPEVV